RADAGDPRVAAGGRPQRLAPLRARRGPDRRHLARPRGPRALPRVHDPAGEGADAPGGRRPHRPPRPGPGARVSGYTVLRPGDDGYEFKAPSWRPEEPVRRIVELPLHARLQHSRAHLWRYPAGAAGRHHRPLVQEEVFFVAEGTMTIELGEERELFEL